MKGPKVFHVKVEQPWLLTLNVTDTVTFFKKTLPSTSIH